MPKSSFSLAQKVSDSIESEYLLSFDRIKAVLRERWRILAYCAVITPVIAVAVAQLVPLTFHATAQLLISPDDGSALLLAEGTRHGGAAPSGQSAAEIVRSVPVVARMAEAEGVTNADVARPAYKVLFGYVSRAIVPFLHKDKDDGAGAKMTEWEFLANEIKPSIKATSLQSEVRSLLPSDQIVEVTIASTNKAKVAAMANGLLEAFIANQAHRNEAEALKAYDTLLASEKKTRDAIALLQQAPTKQAADSETPVSEHLPQERPLAEAMSRNISELELRLIELQHAYSDDSPNVIRARSELKQARQSLDNQESIDALLAQVADLKKAQRQALINADLARGGQTGLSIMEHAMPPRDTSLLMLLRNVVPAVAGLFFGLVIGVVMVVVTTSLDKRVRTRWDVESAVGAMPLAELDGQPEPPDWKGFRTAALPPGMARILAQLELGPTGAGRFLAVAAPGGGERSAPFALLLASALARDPRKKVLLVETEGRPSDGKGAIREGLAELLLGAPLERLLQPTAIGNLQVLSAGGPQGVTGFCKSDWRTSWDGLATAADFIVIGGNGLAGGGPAEIFTSWSDFSLLVVEAGVTEIPALREAALKASSGSGRLLGAMLIKGRRKGAAT